MKSLPIAEVAAVCRLSALNTSGRLMKFGREKNFLAVVEESLALFLMLACEIFYKSLDCKTTDEAEHLYERLKSNLSLGLNEKIGPDFDTLKVESGIEFNVSLLTFEKSFHNSFWAFWHGNLEALRITPFYLGELAKIGVKMPTENNTDVARFAFIVRQTRYGFFKEGVMPPLADFKQCESAFAKEYEQFLKLIGILLND